MKIAIVTDAWTPQVNGVVRTLEATRRELEAMGHDVAVLSPDPRWSVACPTYPEIRLAITRRDIVGRKLTTFGAEAIHLSTEGPMCLAARSWCGRRALPFTTAYHTQFPDYVAARTGADPEWIWRYIRWFHAPSRAILASTPSIEATLRAHGLHHVERWGRGVDLAVFTPHGARDATMAALAGPVQLYVGRVAVEKNIEAFLDTRQFGTKVVVGDGPAREKLSARYPDAVFLGARFGEELAACYRAADVFVFPSRTDTFGLVMIEALACGTPVAAYPVPGPVDILVDGVGAIDDDLDVAIGAALACDADACVAHAATFTWRASAEQFVGALAPMTLPRAA